MIKFVINFPIYLVVLLVEMVKANLDVALRVINPSLPISPGFVKVRTDLKSDWLKFILANSITLTPGTMTLDVEEQELTVHWIKAGMYPQEKAKELICGRFERILKRMES